MWYIQFFKEKKNPFFLILLPKFTHIMFTNQGCGRFFFVFFFFFIFDASILSFF